MRGAEPHRIATIGAALQHRMTDEGRRQSVTGEERGLEWQQAQQQGVKLHNTLFNRAQHEPAFIKHLLHTAEKLQQHRLENFTGAMLYHHSLLSSKYMALWIEEKNKNGL